MKVASMVFHEATPVQIKRHAPSAIAQIQVSPTEPGTSPFTMSQKDCDTGVPVAICVRGVAPEKPSTSA